MHHNARFVGGGIGRRNTPDTLRPQVAGVNVGRRYTGDKIFALTIAHLGQVKYYIGEKWPARGITLVPQVNGTTEDKAAIGPTASGNRSLDRRARDHRLVNFKINIDSRPGDIFQIGSRRKAMPKF